MFQSMSGINDTPLIITDPLLSPPSLEPSTVLPSASSPEERTEYKDQLLRRSLPPSNPSILTSKAQADKEFQLLHFLAFALNSVRRASTGTTEASGAHILLP
ncbi:hypothetical protein AB1N83_006824 [Pleurotus pulmonarius]